MNLSVRPRVLDDPFGFILERARGKRVLNVGASGGVEHYLPANRAAWLHERLGRVAREIVGIDIDEESIRYAATHGVTIEIENCETCRFSRPFDVIVMSDVIEHVNAPIRAIENLVGQLSDDGHLIVTTPNLTHYGLVLRAWLGRRTDVYYDHVNAFLPEHFEAICMRLGCRLSDVIFFSHLDTRTFRNLVKSRIARVVGRIVPRAHGTVLVVFEAMRAS